MQGQSKERSETRVNWNRMRRRLKFVVACCLLGANAQDDVDDDEALRADDIALDELLPDPSLNVVEIDLAHRGVTGTLDAARLLPYAETLVRLELDGNKISGTIPPEIGAFTRLRHLMLSDNQLSGTLPKELSALCENGAGEEHVAVELAENRISGTLPRELGCLAHAGDFHVNDNRISGTLPTSLGVLLGKQRHYGATEGSSVRLDHNLISGTIPPEIGRLTAVSQLALDNNRLSGTLPAELGRLTGLRDLLLTGNQISGTVPDALHELLDKDATLEMEVCDAIECDPAEDEQDVEAIEAEIRSSGEAAGELAAESAAHLEKMLTRLHEKRDRRRRWKRRKRSSFKEEV